MAFDVSSRAKRGDLGLGLGAAAGLRLLRRYLLAMTRFEGSGAALGWLFAMIIRFSFFR
jgi:hypothetical protein